jgi:ankyrin repeat protein/beta-lactamase regulating signal transducer with metallopeptidase domain
MTPLLETLARLQSASGIEGFLATLAVKGTLVLALGFAAALCLRRAPAAARHLAWCATFAGLLLLPAVALWAPPVALPLLPPAGSGVAGGGVAPGAAPHLDRASAADPSARSLSTREPSRAERTPAAPPGSGSRWSALLPAAYLAGAGAFLAYLVAGGLRARRLRRGARSLDAEPGWRSLLASLRAALGIGRDLSVEVSDRVAVPLAWGLRRPTVLLPAGAEAWDASQRRDVLVHELAHVARHDWLSQLGARVACALYWFHPLAWIAARRLVLEAERACDDRVLAAGADSCDYAERLLRIAGAARAARDPSYAAVAMARRSDLATRIQAILDARVPRGALRSAHAALLAGALLLPAGFLASATLARAEGAGGGGGTARLDSGLDRGFNGDLDLDRDLDSDEDRDWEDDADDRHPVGGLSPLLRAAHDGDPAEVRRLLDAGADPNHTETLEGRWRDVQRSALGGAARGGHLEVAELLLDRGARVELTPRGDASPLMIAAGHGHGELVRLLLARGADSNRIVPGDGTPLIAAVRGGDAEIVRILLAEGAEPDVYVEGDESPLYHAIESGDREMIRLLLDHGADPNAEWPGDGNPMILAAAERRDDLVELLLEAGADVDRGVRGDGNALIQAAGRGDLRTVRSLLVAGADPNAAVEGDGSPLIQAADAGYLEIARLLVEEGADLDLVVPGDENPLIRAAGAGHLEVVRFLLDRGADPNVRTFEPSAPWRPGGEVRSPLLQARRGGHDDVVRLLLASGARE